MILAMCLELSTLQSRKGGGAEIRANLRNFILLMPIFALKIRNQFFEFCNLNLFQFRGKQLEKEKLVLAQEEKRLNRIKTAAGFDVKLLLYLMES